MSDDFAGSRADVESPSESAADVEYRREAEAWASRLRLSLEDLQVFIRHGFYYEKIPATNTPARRALLAYLKKRGVAPAKWSLISGLYPEENFSEPERRKRLRALYKTTVLLIKRALAQQLADGDPDRSIYWEPTAEVCRDLDIAQSKLSSFIKEYCGHSLAQLADCVRAERLQKLMRRKIRAFVSEFVTQCATSGTESGEAATVSTAWEALQESRRWPAFCRNTWAIGFGFSSYRKMYRACLAVYRQTPHQLELSLIAECLAAPQRVDERDEAGFGLEEIRAALAAIRPYENEEVMGSDLDDF